jgi:aryl-alcohol dehydrogenase-like predicted oxidoreductase
MQLTHPDEGWMDLALRWAVFSPGVSSAIVGTSQLDHLLQAIQATEKGSLDVEVRNQISTAFSVKDRGWQGRV